MDIDAEELRLTAYHLLVAKYIQVSGLGILLYDHFITFDIELEKIWKRRVSLGSALFLVNRYGTPLQYVAIINAFHDPRWTKELCDKYSVFEGASSVAMVGICELVMILRVYALYARSKRVLVFLMTLWTAQIVLSAIGLSTGFAIPLPPGLVGCIYTGTHHLFPCLWVTPLVTDSVIFFMTIWRGRRYLTSFSGSPTNHVFVRDGAIYFLVIFLSNLANTLIFFVTTRGDLKPIAASFNQLLTSTMISRLVLNLRSAGIHEDNQPPGFTIPPISHDLRFAGRTTAAQGFTAISTVTEVTETTEGQKSEDIMLSDFSQAPAMDFKRSFPDPGEDVEFDRTRLVGGPRAV